MEDRKNIGNALFNRKIILDYELTNIKMDLYYIMIPEI